MKQYLNFKQLQKFHSHESESLHSQATEKKPRNHKNKFKSNSTKKKNDSLKIINRLAVGLNVRGTGTLHFFFITSSNNNKKKVIFQTHDCGQFM